MNEGFFIAEVLCDKNGTPCDYRHIDVNPAYEENSGLIREQLLGKTATEVFFPSPNPLAMEKFCEAGLLGKSSHFEIYSEALGRHLDVHAFPCGAGRFGAVFMDISERKQMELALRDLNATLESKVIQRTAELKRRTEQLQRLAIQLSLAEERERKRIGAFLHEDLQQQIAGAKFHLNLLSKQAKDDPEQKSLLAKVDEMLREAIEKSRSLSHELSPDVLSRNDLAETFRWLADRMYASHGLRVRVDARSEATLQSDAITIFLFRAVQEMLSNVIQHAGVRDAAIRMSRHGRYVRVSVSDRGKGFDPQAPKETPGFGLFNIRERAELLGGRMKVRSRPGEGSTLSIIVPDEVTPNPARRASDVNPSHNSAP
jgi:signal transduction histidine kinase